MAGFPGYALPQPLSPGTPAPPCGHFSLCFQVASLDCPSGRANVSNLNKVEWITAPKCSEGESKILPPFFFSEASLSPSSPLQHHFQEDLFLKLQGSLDPFFPKYATRGASGRNPGQPFRLQGPCMWDRMERLGQAGHGPCLIHHSPLGTVLG